MLVSLCDPARWPPVASAHVLSSMCCCGALWLLRDGRRAILQGVDLAPGHRENTKIPCLPPLDTAGHHLPSPAGGS